MSSRSSDYERLPPHSLEAEVSTIGSLLIDRDALSKITDIIGPGDFYHDANRHVFEALTDLFEKGEPVDYVTVMDELRRKGLLEAVGGIGYITQLASAVPTSANVDYYARIVEQKSLLRALISAGTKIAKLGYESEENVETAVEEAERTIFAISQKRTSQTFVDLKSVLVNTFDNIEKLYSNKGAITGVSSGFPDLDNMISGFQPADLVIIAARPSMGKTSLGLNIAQYASVVGKVPIGFFSLEMPGELLAQRLLSGESNIDMQRLRRGYLTDADWPRLSHALARLSEAPFYIDDSPSATVAEMRAKARRLKSDHGLGLIFIDYLGLIAGKGRTESRQQEIAEITRALKQMARELNVPVIAMAQLSRAVEATADKRPMLSHLKESGEIEASADVVAFIFREDYYNPDTDRKGIAEIIIAKHRNGPTGTVELGWNSATTKFVSLEKYRPGDTA